MTKDDNRVRCKATTKSGQPCKIFAGPGQDYCHVHARQTQPETKTSAEMQQLINELDALLLNLKKTLPESGRSPYSPMRFLTYIRENLHKLSPELRLGLLENFEGMTKEDLMDIETWKGMAYMMNYSARFQATQVKDRMNEHLPQPLQPDTWLRFMKQSLDKATPEVAKNIMGTFQEASKEDLMDPDTWKGVWTMLDYSMRFQAEQFRQKLTGEIQDEE